MPTLLNRICLYGALTITCLCLAVASTRGDIISRLDRGESLVIVALGTSLTNADHSSWFGHMGRWLNHRYPGKVTLFNEAISGSASKYNTSYNLTNYPERYSGLDMQLGAAFEHSPDAVFIEFAINDAYTPYAISQKDLKDNLRTIIGRIKKWASDNGKLVDIVVQTTNNCIDKPELGTNFASHRPDLEKYYQGYRDVVQENKGVLLIDHYQSWLNLFKRQADHKTWKSYVPDGLHPNDQGTRNLILPVIKRTLQRQASEYRAWGNTFRDY